MKYIASLLILFMGTVCFSQTGWFIVQSGLPQTNDLFFPSPDTGYVVGDNGFAQRSIDGGKTWQPTSIQNEYTSKANFYSISFPTAKVGYIAGNLYGGYGIILKTSDGGETWNKTPYSLPFFINQIIFSTAEVGYIRGDSGSGFGNGSSLFVLSKSKDGGANWVIIDSSRCLGVDRMVWKNENQGLLIYENHCAEPLVWSARYTSNGGISFLPPGNYNIFSGSEELHGVGSGNAQTWFLADHDGYAHDLRRSDDNNFQWQGTSHLIKYLSFGAFFFFNGNNGYCSALSDITPIYKTTDNGVNWFAQYSDSSIKCITGCAPDNKTAYILAWYDTLKVRKWKILKTIDGGGPLLTVVRQFDQKLTDFFLVENPVLRKAKFNFLPSSLTRKLKVIDLLGRMIREENIPNGTTNFSLDLKNIPEGIYFCSVGPESLKMVVSKE